MIPPSSDVPGYPDPDTLGDLQLLSLPRAQSIPRNPMARRNLYRAIQASIARAQVVNPVESTPWFRPPTWATNGQFQKGQVVASTDGVNAFVSTTFGNNAYSAGATSGSGPTGAGNAWIVDNAVTWEGLGPIRGQAAFSASTVQFGTEAAMSALVGANLRTLVLTPGVFDDWVSGGFVNQASGRYWIQGSNYQSAAAPAYGNPPTAAITFRTNADKFALLFGGPAYNAGPPGLRIEVNNVALSDTTYYAVGTTNPGSMFVDLSFLPRGSEKKVRILSNDGLTGSRAIATDVSADVWADRDANAVSMVVDGDSLTQGGNGTPYWTGGDWVTQTASMLGFSKVANAAQGGTGFVSNASGVKSTLVDRAPRLAALAGDVYVVAGNHNDVTFGVTRVAAMQQWYQIIRAARPNALIIGIGNTLLRDEYANALPGQPMYLCEQDMATTWAGFNDPLCLFIPVLTDPQTASWIRGTGSIQAPVNDGNMSTYYSSGDSHPIQRGQNYFAKRYASAIRAAIAEQDFN